MCCISSKLLDKRMTRGKPILSVLSLQEMRILDQKVQMLWTSSPREEKQIRHTEHAKPHSLKIGSRKSHIQFNSSLLSPTATAQSTQQDIVHFGSEPAWFCYWVSTTKHVLLWRCGSGHINHFTQPASALAPAHTDHYNPLSLGAQHPHTFSQSQGYHLGP